MHRAARAFPVTNRCASSVGAAPKRLRPRVATTHSRRNTALPRSGWRWLSATPRGKWQAPSSVSHPWRSSTRTWTHGEPDCRPSSWRRSTKSAGKFGTRLREPWIVSKKTHVSETPATQWLRAHGVPFTEHPYDYLDHGGAQHSAEVLGLDSFTVIKTLVMQDQDA